MLSGRYESEEIFAGGHARAARRRQLPGQDARAALVDMDVCGANVQVALWARNLFDNKDLTNAPR